MALWTVVVDLQRFVVVLHRFVELVEHVESITKIVICWCILWIQFNGLLVILHSFVIMLLDTEGIAQVVE